MEAKHNDREINCIELDEEIANRKSDKKRIQNELKLLEKRRGRWSKIDLGLLQTIVMGCLRNVSRKTSMILTITLNITFSLFDIGSDIYVAVTLFQKGEWKYGIFVVLLDYLPGWELVLHNYFSQKWRRITNLKERRIMILFLLVSPFSLPLFFLHWLMAFKKANNETFNFLHHNARLTQLLVGSVESPLQVMMLFFLWSEGKLDPPWSENFQIVDLIGRKVDFDIFPGMLSLIMSVLVILKGSLEIAEARSKGENIAVCGYAFSNLIFRLGSFSFAIIYFREWSIILFSLVAFLNVMSIIRDETSKRESFSIATSALISIFTPFISSDQPHKFQRISPNDSAHTLEKNIGHRRNLSSYMALLTTPPILLCDVILYCLLKYYPEFKYSDETILCKQASERILFLLIFPGGISATLAALSFRTKFSASKTEDSTTVYQNKGNYFSIDEIFAFIEGTVLRRLSTSLRHGGIMFSIVILIIGGVMILNPLPTCPNG